jgi:hypothetical protein
LRNTETVRSNVKTPPEEFLPVVSEVFPFLKIKKIPRNTSEIGSVRTEAVSLHVSDTKQFTETLSETPPETIQK